MWYGQTIYFLADHDEHQRANIWAYDLGTKQFRQVTHFTDYDSLGSSDSRDAAIVFQQAGHLFVMDLPGEQLHQLDVTVPDDGTRTGARWEDAKALLRETDTAGHTDFDLARNGARAAFARGGCPGRRGDAQVFQRGRPLISCCSSFLLSLHCAS